MNERLGVNMGIILGVFVGVIIWYSLWISLWVKGARNKSTVLTLISATFCLALLGLIIAIVQIVSWSNLESNSTEKVEIERQKLDIEKQKLEIEKQKLEALKDAKDKK